MKRARAVAYWTIPSLVCLVLYWPGLRAWFQKDDFFWLFLDASVRDAPTLLKALFEPLAQGTIRPLSERAFFMLFHQAFGLWATPFRAAVLLTQLANLVLLGLVVRRVTRSRAAGFLAPLFWAVNGALGVAMSWTSAYNQVLCAFFLLLAFYCFVRYAETGDHRFLIAQWVVFVLGFGALEVNAVYPVLAAAYALCCAPKAFRKTWPMFGVSTVYSALHFWAAPVGSSAAVYALHFDASVLGAFWTYWRWALGSGRLPQFVQGVPAWAPVVGVAALTAALAGFLAWRLWRREWAVLAPVVWYVATLLPVLPLRDHVESYYLTIPAAGLAWLLAAAVESLWRQSWLLKAPAVALVALYAVTGAIAGRIETRVIAAHSHDVRTLVWGAFRVHQLHPGKAILFDGLDSDLFWASVASQPFRVVGVTDVAVTPESAARIKPQPQLGRASDYVMPPPVLLDALARGAAVVYKVEDGRLRAVTLPYWVTARQRWTADEPRRVDVGQPAFAGLLGPSWYNPYRGQRWMPTRATVRLGGPRSPGETLYATGFCPAVQVASGPLAVTLGIEGGPHKTYYLSRGDAAFSLALPLPPQLVGKKWVGVFIEVDRTFTAPPDLRELGLAFGMFEIRQ